MRVVVNETLAESGAEHLVGAQSQQGLGQIFRKKRSRRFVWRVGGRAGIKPARDAVEPGVYLRREVEVRICCGLADAVFQTRRWIAGLTKHADHHAAVIACPDGTIRRE